MVKEKEKKEKKKVGCKPETRRKQGATHRSCDTALNSARFSTFVWMRKLAVRTNWPTVALKPERKALKG